jgi:hypothetical protein
MLYFPVFTMMRVILKASEPKFFRLASFTKQEIFKMRKVKIIANQRLYNYKDAKAVSGIIC